MTLFIRLIQDADKQEALAAAVTSFGVNGNGSPIFSVDPDSFKNIPGAPFAYWVSDAVRESFVRMNRFSSTEREAQHGCSTKDDFRFLRVWWELADEIGGAPAGWTLYAKGGTHAPFYADVSVCVRWKNDAEEIEAAVLKKYPYLNGDANWILHRECNYFVPGLFQTLRSAALAPHLTPSGCLFGHNGFQAFVPDEEIFAWMALFNSKVCDAYFKLMLGRAGWALYTAGTMSRMPVPSIAYEERLRLDMLGRHAWSLRRTIDTIEETSHAFLLPAVLRPRLRDYDLLAIETELAQIQVEIDDIAFGLYGFSDSDRVAVTEPLGVGSADNAIDENEDDAEPSEPAAPPVDALLSWAVGVAFGRFDWRLATGERQAPTEPDPFDPLPAKSPGMLPEGAEGFHTHASVLVDDHGHPHDLARLVEEVLGCVEVAVPDDVRRRLRRDFFPFHLQRYSRSRRKAPIYWPLSTTSGSYTLWVYSPDLSSQTLYTAINDFVEPKLKQVGDDVTILREKGSDRTADNERQFEALQAFELELIELRGTLHKLAPLYKPNNNDGAQISASPLWSLFRHKPWQKVLKDTWGKLEKGDYDWAHLAMHYWPERVREKCKTDKSLAIAHGLEDLYVEPEAAPTKTRGRKRPKEANGQQR